ncbi:MAG: GDP-mannose 4,6-dehydratase [Deltaproteobacteria bacterium]|nr:GDP-mannose 4,6-dehydratase [Deltaproteobacteria bacterium]
MRILITGGAGFIGSHLVGRMLANGDEVAIVDDFNEFYSPSIKRSNIKEYSDNKNFRSFEADIRYKEKVLDVLNEFRPEVICHLAARAGVRPSIEDPILYEEVNCKGTLNILEAVRFLGLELKNFVFASSSSVYGLNTKVPFSEEDHVNEPISPYAVTKRSCELMLKSYSHLYNIPATCLRFFTVYGERGRPDMAIAKFTQRIHQGVPIEVYGDGSAKRDFTYIGDIIDGVEASISRPFDFEIINIGESKVVVLKDLIAIIEKEVGKKADIRFMDPCPGDMLLTNADISKARRLLGYDPKTDIETGVARYVKWYIENNN